MKAARWLSLLFATALLLPACGDDDGTGAAGGSGGGGGDGGAAEGGAADGGAGVGGGETSAVVPTITEVALFGDCMPKIAADPVSGSITVAYANGGAADGELTVDEATLLLQGAGSTLAWTFSVDPDRSGTVTAGGMVEVVHDKVTESGVGGDPGPCSYCGSTGTLTMHWSDADGNTATSSIDIESFECAF